MIPFAYSHRNLRVRWKTTLMTASGFTLVVAALVVMLAFVNGMLAVCTLHRRAGKRAGPQPAATPTKCSARIDREVVIRSRGRSRHRPQRQRPAALQPRDLHCRSTSASAGRCCRCAASNRSRWRSIRDVKIVEGEMLRPGHE